MNRAKDHSIWERESFYQRRDVVVVGAGIVGLQTAIQLKKQKPKINLAIVEQSISPIGASSRNAGFVCFGSVSELIEDIDLTSTDICIELISNRYEGLSILMETVNPTEMLYQQLGGYEIFTESVAEIDEHIERCNDLVSEAIGMSGTFKQIKNHKGFNNIQHLIYNQYEGQINTGKMYLGLVRLAQSLGIDIYRGWRLLSYDSHSDGVTLTVKNMPEMHSDHLVICTNAFTNQISPQDDLMPGRNQVLITKAIPGLSWKGCYHYDRGYVYFRDYQDRVIIGGGRNIGGAKEVTTELGTTESIKDYLRAILRDVVLPNVSYSEDYWWSGIIATGSSKRPIISERNNVYHGIRLGGMGVALGSWVGRQLAQMISAKY